MSEVEPGPEGAGPHQPLPIAPSLRRAQRFSAGRAAERLVVQPRRKARPGVGTETPQHREEEEEEEEEEHGGGARLGVKPPPATGAHGEDGSLSSAGRSPCPGTGCVRRARAGRRAAPWSLALTDDERGASGLGSCCTIEPGYRPGRAAPLPPASLPLIPSGLTSLPVFLGRAPASRNACSCHTAPAAVRRCFHYRGFPSPPGSLLHRFSCLPFALQRASLHPAALPA